jgi:3-hydroxyacyl-[acyl-carrier-protein] dehydratase
LHRFETEGWRLEVSGRSRKIPFPFLLSAPRYRMRWFWIDRFTEFERGRRAVAIKALALSEEQFDGYTPGYPIMAGSLMIEGMAQTAGLLVGEMEGFAQRVVLAKIGKAVFQRTVTPGETLRYEATITDVKSDGALASVNAFIGEELVAEVDLMFAFLDDRFPSGPLFEPVDFAAMLRAFHMYDVGRTADGQPLELPAFYVEAEREARAKYDPIPSPVKAD